MSKEQVNIKTVGSTWVGASVSQKNKPQKTLAQVLADAQKKLSEVRNTGKKLNDEQDREGMVILR
jgi:hypothetical protein